MSQWLKFLAWLGAVTVACWLWGFVFEWRILGTLFLAGGPLLLWRGRDFQQSVSPAGVVVVLCGVGFLVFAAFLGWNRSSNEWFEQQLGVRVASAFLVWVALAAAGYYALLKRPAA
jgi:hypothetical protein